MFSRVLTSVEQHNITKKECVWVRECVRARVCMFKKCVDVFSIIECVTTEEERFPHICAIIVMFIHGSISVVH